MSSKITIIGAGSVGATIAYKLSYEDIASEIVMIDINKDKVEEKFVDKEKNRWEIKKNLSTGVCGKGGGSSTAFHRTGCDRNFPQAGCKTFWGNGGKLRG